MATEFFPGQTDYIEKLNELWDLAMTGGGGGGIVQTVVGTAPVSVTGTATARTVAMAAATASVNGYMTAAYAAKLDGIPPGGAGVTLTVNATPPGSPVHGQEWIDTTSVPVRYTWIVDVDGGQWVNV